MDYTLKKIVTRFAPSPTGFLHIGGYRTALFNFLFAKKNNGKFILRIDDTDKERSKKEYEEDILAGINWLNLKFDELYKQSERLEIYKKNLEKMISTGEAYVSKEEIKEVGERSEVIRFKNPNIEIKFEDLIRGEIKFDTTELGDFVIAKSETEPLYHLASVIDDFEMGITHIIRGEEHISNTPRQILIQMALKMKQPVYAHIPLILAPDRTKLSKRHGAQSLTEFREEGYLSEALINYMALLGWNPGTDQEIFTIEELIEQFDISKIQKGGAIFNKEKLNWINKEHIKNLDGKETAELIKNYLDKYKKRGWEINNILKTPFINLIIERISKFGDLKDLILNGELDCFFEEPSPQKDQIYWKKDENENMAINHLKKACQILENLQDNEYNAKIIKERLMEYAENQGKGSVLWPLRFALSGKERSPDPFALAEVLGKEETLKRWKKAINILKQN